MMPFKPLPQTDPKLDRLLKEAAEKYNAMQDIILAKPGGYV